MADSIEIENGDVSLTRDSDDVEPDRNVGLALSYDEFFAKFLIANRPCVFDSELTKGWRCRDEWAANGAPNFKILNELFGDCEAPVADCRRKYYNSQFKDDSTIARYLEYWTEYREKNYPDSMPLLYLKDWHCPKNHPDLNFYEVPKFLASDWLNEFYTAHPELDDDYMFVYMGPKGTWTPFHADVFTSYSWSANIVGRKRWLLFPPGEENRLRDIHGQLSFDATSEELRDRKKYPNYDESSLRRHEIIQEAGEIIFVPSGWHHQVWNLEDTISVNHNWINGCNVWSVWQALRRELLAVMREVDDCRDMEDWEKHCQLMLKASHGMDYSQFYKFVSFIARRRLAVLKDQKVLRSFGKWTIGPNHCSFDLLRAKAVIVDMVDDARERNIHEIVFADEESRSLVDEIDDALGRA